MSIMSLKIAWGFIVFTHVYVGRSIYPSSVCSSGALHPSLSHPTRSAPTPYLIPLLSLTSHNFQSSKMITAFIEQNERLKRGYKCCLTQTMDLFCT